MSGFCGSNDSAESSPVDKDSGDSMRFPPGFRFYHTEEEIMTNYLHNLPQNAKNEWVMKSSPEKKAYSSGIQKLKLAKMLLLSLILFLEVQTLDWASKSKTCLCKHVFVFQNEWVICKVFLGKKAYSSRIQKLKLAVMHNALLLHLIFLAIQTHACSYLIKSNLYHDFSSDEGEVGKHKVNCCRRSTLKRKDNNNEYVGGVRQLQPKLQKSKSDAENPASSMSSHINTTMEDNSRVCVKVVGYNNDTVMFLLPFPTMDCLKAEILKRFNHLESANFKITYKDEDEDMVTIACDEDLHYCFEFFKSTGTTPVRLVVFT